MTITKEWTLRILESMPEPFSIDDFIEKIIITRRNELAHAEVENGNWIAKEELDRIISKWSKKTNFS